MKVLSSIIAISLSIAATAVQARDPLSVEVMGRAGPVPMVNGVGTQVATQARKQLDVAQVMGRGQPLSSPAFGSAAPRAALANALVAKRMGRV